MSRPILPDTASVGDAGHSTDHNTIVAALTELYAENAGGISLAPLASPALTGNPTAPTPTAGDNDTSIATTAFVRANTVRVTRPNTDDRLVEVWNGASWSVVDYHSSDRQLAASIESGFVVHDSLILRRTLNHVSVTVWNVSHTAGSAGDVKFLTLPSGFYGPGAAVDFGVLIDEDGPVHQGYAYADGAYIRAPRAGVKFAGTFVFQIPGSAGVPLASLPGTLSAAAPL
jgi:hypothetical protein